MAPPGHPSSSTSGSSLKRKAPGSSAAAPSATSTGQRSNSKGKNPYDGTNARNSATGGSWQQANGKPKLNRNGQSSAPPNSNYKNRKRVKSQDARAIAAQTSDKALNRNGELDVDRFVRAREFEIRALEEGMGRAKGALTTRAFQQVPRSLRRRTASHNVKRVPKRLRKRAEREMAEDNTPTVTARRRQPNSHMRLRRQTARRLQKLGERAKAKNEASSTGDDLPSKDQASLVRLQIPKMKKNTLNKPPKPVSKFHKRQIHKTWLPTHIFHTKRAHLTEPKEPLWRFAIPLRPSEKSYRPTHRASSARGAVAWDMSYMSTIGLEGTEVSLQGLLKKLGVGQSADSQGLWGKNSIKWRNGSRTWEGWVYKGNACPSDAIAPVTIIWRAKGPVSETASTKRQILRRILMRVQPSSFLQLWNELLALAKTQRPQVSVEDLRFEIGSIEVTGPGSTEALLGTLRPSRFQEDKAYAPDSPENIWLSLNGLTNPASLPPSILLGFDISDPRLHQPPRTVPKPKSATAEHDLLQVMAFWPPDNTQIAPALFDRTARQVASRLLPSQKAINRRKGLALPGQYPSALPNDPQIPTLIYPSRNGSSVQSTWTVLLPWKCVLPVWYSLMYYPLSSGGNVRFGGLNQVRQVAFENSRPWFPGDYPGTQAGWEWEMQERANRKDEWIRRPKGQRIQWESLDLGENRKGEIGVGYACDWELLLDLKSCSEEHTSLQGHPVSSADDTSGNVDVDMQDAGDASSHDAVKESAQSTQQVTPSPKPETIIHLPRGVAQEIFSRRPQTSPSHGTLSVQPDHLKNALATVKITLLGRGVPTSCARIYRLPTNNPSLRAKWLSLNPSIPPKHKKKTADHQTQPPVDDPLLSRALRRQQLAASLLSPPSYQRKSRSDTVPQAGDFDYPVVPDAHDLIGFVTTGNFNLGHGRGTGIGCVSLEMVCHMTMTETQTGSTAQDGGAVAVESAMDRDTNRTQSHTRAQRTLCIVREAGQSLGRLARWELI